MIQFHVINNPNDEKVMAAFYEKELQKTNQQEFSIEKVIKNGKVIIVHLIIGLIKKDSIKLI